jgi:myo-inositol-1(or 4)-monophosphatase
MDAILRTARDAATAGGEVLMSYSVGDLDIRTKAVADMVSDADVHAEQAIVDCIRRQFPDHAILGEEGHSAVGDEPHLWVVDPLDGTTNYLHQIPHFAVSIGYYENGVGKVGVVYNPATDEWFTAIRGEGAFRNGAPIEVNTESALEQVLIGVGFYYDRGELMQRTLAAVGDFFGANIHGIRRFGTASLDLCQVAMGRYGLFFEYILSPWDFAAGRIIVEEAGGRVTTCDGGELGLVKSTVLASNGHLHDTALAITSKHLA